VDARRAVVALVGALLVAALLAGDLAARPATAAGRDAPRVLPDGRSYVTHEPGRPVSAAVVVLHSLHHDWLEGPAQGWSAESERSGFLAVYPEGDGSWNAGLCCAPANDPACFPAGPGQATGRDDVGFLTRVIADVRARYRVRHVWLAGYSNGGMMAERLLAERPWLSDRLAVWASAPEMAFPGAWTGRAWLGHGALDATVPWAGGITTIAGHQVPMRPGQATPRWLVGARLSARVYIALGHAPPAWWPQAAWAALAAP
jgi:polyhydroxybutyrate depolymerase